MGSSTGSTAGTPPSPMRGIAMYCKKQVKTSEIHAIITAVMAGMSRGDYQYPWQRLDVLGIDCRYIRTSDVMRYLWDNPIQAGMLHEFSCQTPHLLGKWLKATRLIVIEREWTIAGKRCGRMKAVNLRKLGALPDG